MCEWRFFCEFICSSLAAGISAPGELETKACILGQFSSHNSAKEVNSINFPAKLQNVVSSGRCLRCSRCNLVNKVLLILSPAVIVTTSINLQLEISRTSSWTRLSTIEDGNPCFTVSQPSIIISFKF